jgi:hypothetical protein
VIALEVSGGCIVSVFLGMAFGVTGISVDPSCDLSCVVKNGLLSFASFRESQLPDSLKRRAAIVGHHPPKHATMSGLEVAAAVMGIVAAFTTATDFFSRLRGKRKAKKAAKAKAKQEQEEVAKEESVDKSLVLGRQEVRREYDTDLARLGPEFQRGDETGVRQVQNMLIHLQNNVISVLTNLLTSSDSGLDDAVNKSVVGLLKASDRTRKGTVRALKDQYQRMSIKKPLRAGPKPKKA